MTKVSLVGLNEIDHGRQCASHIDGCGKSLKTGSVVHFKSCKWVNETGKLSGLQFPYLNTCRLHARRS